MCVGVRGDRRVIQTLSIIASALPFASLTAAKKRAIRVSLRTHHSPRVLLGSAASSLRARQPENSHTALLTGSGARDTGAGFLCAGGSLTENEGGGRG